MKNLYAKSKGKIHPSPSSSSSSSSFSSSSSPLSILALLPPAIFTIVSLLSLSDREVLAYLILRSLQNPTSFKSKTPTTKCKKPIFDCGCFDCYTSFWIRWDSSPSRELIHQAIEAFEDHLNDLSNKTHKAKPRKRRVSSEKSNKTGSPTPQEVLQGHLSSHVECSKKTQKGKRKNHRVSAEKTEVESVSEAEPEILKAECNGASATIAAADAGADEVVNGEGEGTGNRLEAVVSVQQLPGGNNRGLVRKVWPDVLGIFNSRLWSLWGPNV